MQFIQLKNIHFTYPDQYQAVLSGIDLVIADHEKIALIGKNGTGKTTLLRIILGELLPTAGQINYPTSQPHISYLPQDIKIQQAITVKDYLLSVHAQNYLLIKEIERLSAKAELSDSEGMRLSSLWHDYHNQYAEDWVQEVESMLSAMNLLHLQKQGCTKLSGGESTRLNLAALLLEKPDILILDEPTNHLDLQQIQWLEDWLNTYHKAVLYVSHDKRFIDNTATKIAELNQGKLEIRMGNYQSFERDKQHLQHHQLVQYHQRKRLIQNLREAAQKRRSWASSFQSETRWEGGGKVYESIFNEVRTQMQQARNIEKRISMLNERYPIDRPMFEKERNVVFEPVKTRKQVLINISQMSFGYDKRKLFHNFDFYLGGNERIWLSGPNGCGKTTLLKLIAGILSPAEGSISYASRLKIGYFQQDLSYLNTADIVIDSLRASYRDETYIRTLMGCIGLDNTIAQKSFRDLSWGEKAKVQIMDLLLKKHNVLLLDEPTNHLDMKRRELLGNALNEYSGALIFVSHDRAFIDQLCTREVKL